MAIAIQSSSPGILAPVSQVRAAMGAPTPSPDLVQVLEALHHPVCVADAEQGVLLFTNGAFRSDFPRCAAGRLADFDRGFSTPPSESLSLRATSSASAATSPTGEAVADCFHTASQRWYRIRTRTITRAGAGLAVVLTAENVTDALASQQRHASEQERLLMTSRLMSVGELVSTLAHELNQPLGAATNYLAGVLRLLQSGRTDVLAALEMAHRQVDHAAKIVSRMREFVRTREPRREIIRLAEIVDSVLKLMELPAQQSRVRTRVRIPAALPAVLGDRVMIEQVVLNLVKNALEAMAAIPPSARALTLEGRDDGEGALELVIADSGPGLPESASEQLYSPFFTTKPEGMGMGLNICRSIMEYHQGRLYYRRNDQGGSSFCISLPVYQEGD